MTRQRQTPEEKKQIAYDKDHVVRADYPHAFRRNWPRRKARAARKERRKVRQMLGELVPEQQAEAREAMPIRPVRRDLARKMAYAVPLREHVAHRHSMRVYRTAWNFFKRPYDTALHQVRFAAFLEQITQEDTPHTRKVAAMFRHILQPLSDLRPASIDRFRAQWLRAFLRDEPAWAGRIVEWAASVQEEYEE